MFNYIRGTVINNAGHITLDTGSIGYKVFCSKYTLNRLSENREELLYIELVIREDSWTLYGFAEQAEREWFKLLLTVQGVGAKVALSILSSICFQELHKAIIYNDKHLLCSAEGVGEKLASRIINELKGKALPDDNVCEVKNAAINKTVNQNTIKDDLFSALINLGYKKGDIINVLNGLSGIEDQGFEKMLRIALSKLISI